jgi:hypothetical protein
VEERGGGVTRRRAFGLVGEVSRAEQGASPPVLCHRFRFAILPGTACCGLVGEERDGSRSRT